MPAFNAARHISRAIDSVLAQTFHNFELIIVDDGSTDGTANICEEYAAKDTRVKVFHKPNGGVASARQFGIEQATGRFSLHFDADDYAAPEMLEEMYNTAVETDADVVIADFYVRFSENKIIRFKQKLLSDKSSDVVIGILTGKLFGALWNKLIKTRVFHDKGVFFEPGINYCEDNLVIAKLCKEDDIKIVNCEGVFYTYCRDIPESFTINYDTNKFELRCRYFKEICKVLSDERFTHALEADAWDIKMEAYNHGYLKLKDFDKIYPDSLRFIRYSRASKLTRIKLMYWHIVHKIFR